MIAVVQRLNDLTSHARAVKSNVARSLLEAFHTFTQDYLRTSHEPAASLFVKVRVT